MNRFEKMQEALRAEGWFVEWNMPCCQSCAWGEVEHDDLSKVLFNHSQDCEVTDMRDNDCEYCDGTGFDDEEDVHCGHCEGEGYVSCDFEDLDYEPDTSVGGFVCMPPEIAGSSLFCFDGTDEGVANFKAIIPIIEECGVTVDSFDESGKTRIELSW